jgi:hypothetical protein
VLTEAPRRERLMAPDPEVFRRDFDRAAFAFTHRLAGHPLFSTERLMVLAKQMAQKPGDVYYDAGDVRVDQRWDQVAASDLPLDVLLERIETSGAWVILRSVEKDPEYAALLDECLSEIETLAGRDLRKVMKIRTAIVFITSPRRISAYHMDRECNFLMQIAGSKTISAFDRYDRDLLPEAEIERFWAKDNNAATYKPQYQERARNFELTPGTGIHLPVNAPHWVKNGPEVSVSLSINFHYNDSILGDIYRANYWLRRLGLRPSPPLQTPMVDNAKRVAVGSARRLKRARQRLMGNA